MSVRSLNMSISDARDKEKYLSCLKDLAKVMDVVQSDQYSTKKGKAQDKLRNKLLNEIQKIFNQTGLKIFSETLFRMMIVPFQAKDNPFIAKLMDFFYAIIGEERWDDASQPNSSPNESVLSSLNGSVLEDASNETLPVRMLRLCERYHPESRTIIRQRIMLTVSKIIPDRVQPTDLRRSLQVKLIKMLLIRVKDKSDPIRAISVRILSKFYMDGMPHRDKIFDALLHNMRFDPDHNVRAMVVAHIPITDDSMEHVVERSGDPSAVVRAAAIKRISESIKLASLTVEMREAILKANITQDTPKNIEKEVGNLLETWLKELENDPCEFLRILNVRRRMSLCQTALNSLYNQPPEEAFTKMATPLLNDKKYPEDSLCAESTFLWLYMYKRFKDEPYVMKKLSLPLVDMIDYINEYVEVVEEEGDLPPGDLDYRAWLLGDMLQILALLPGEEGERKAVLEYLPSLCTKKKLMDERNSSLVVKLIAVCSNIHDPEEKEVVNLVNALMDADRPSIRSSLRKSNRNANSASSLQKTEMDNDTYDSLKLEFGNLTHRKKKLERDRDLAAKEDDLYRAQACQDEIKSLEEEIRKVMDKIEEHDSRSMNITTTDGNETQEVEEEWTYSDSTLRIVLSLIKTNILLRDKISDFSRSFFDMYAVSAVAKAKTAIVRAMALELMCIVALDFEEESARTTLYCLMALLRDMMEVKIVALKCLYDLALRYSFAKIGGFPQVQSVLMGSDALKEIPKVQINVDDTASTLKSLLLSYIRHEEIRLTKVSVAGVLKLLFKKEMNSSRLITTFLINWAIPSQDAHARFKDVGIMIPVYATMGVNEANEVAQCLINCIKKSLSKIHGRAPGDDLTPNPDIDKIISLIVKCTDPNKLTEFPCCYIAHETIAKGALKELANPDLTTEEKMIYAKLLKVLNLGHCPSESINQIKHTLSEIAEFSTRTINTILLGFSNHLEALLEDRDSILNTSRVKTETEGEMDDDNAEEITIIDNNNDQGDETSMAVE